MKIRYIMIVLALMLLVGAASAWLPDYNYRKPVHIDGSSAGDLTDYTLLFYVHRTSGTDDGQNVYIEDKCEPDYRDVRFTLADDTELDYWIAGYDSSSAGIWIEIPSITTADGADLYMYYGNSGATSASDGDATFLFFDGFDGATLDTSKWDFAGTPDISGSIITLQDAGVHESIASKVQLPTNTQLIAQSNIGTGGTNYVGYYVSMSDMARIVSGNLVITTNSGVSTQTSIGPYSGWQKWNVIRDGTNSVIFTRGSETVATHTTNIPDIDLNIRLFAYKSTGIVQADYVFVRSRVSPEPWPDGWDAEESYPANVITPDMLPIVITPELVAEAGTTYFELAGDWTSGADDEFAVIIQAPDVVLNGNHYTLTGTPGVYKNAINSDCDNTTVYNLTATGWNHAISYNNVNYGWISMNNLYSNLNSSIGISNCMDIFLSGNTLQDNGENGLFVQDSSGITYLPEMSINTVVSGNPSGISFINVTNGFIGDWEVTADGTFNNNGFAIFAMNSENITANGFFYTDNDFGIRFDNVQGGSILLNTVDGSTYNNIDISNSQDINIQGNSVTSGDEWGVLIVGCSGIVVNDENSVQSNGFGIGILDSDNCTVDNNLVESNSNFGIMTGGDDGCSDILVSHNDINENSGDLASGISAANTLDLTLLGNRLENNGFQGISINECMNVTVRSNEILDHLSPDPNPGTGISIWNTLEANTYDNVLTDNVVGIMCGNSTFNYIRNNTITTTYEDTQFALGLLEGSEMTGLLCVFETSGVHGNVMTGYQQGIALADVADILIFNNYFDNYENYAIGEGTSNISWNVTKTLADPDTNIIGGEYFGGNYWALPSGDGWSQVTPDTDYDGICDDPYVLDASYTDMLPLGGYQPIHAQFSADPTEGIVNGVDPVIVQFTDESIGTIDEWTWNFDDGTTSHEQNPSHSFLFPGVYSVSLTVGSNETDETDTYATFVYMRPMSANGIPIWEGWNFVSTPRSLATGHNTVSQVFSEVETGDQMIWYYNATTPQWETMGESDIILPMDGIWIYSTQVGPFVEFTYNTEFGGSTPRVKHLEPGWNAIGIGSVYGMPTDSYLSTLGEKWSVLLEFDSGIQAYYSPQIRGVETYGMNPGKGYWIYIDEAGDLLAMTG